MENCRDTIAVSKHVGVALHHRAERSFVTKDFIIIFQSNREHFFDITHMVIDSLIQDNEECETLGADVLAIPLLLVGIFVPA